MSLYRIILFIIPVLLLAGCGENQEDSYQDRDENYIVWAGSINGTVVVDATDDAFEFEINTGYLHFGNTTYTNAWVDLDGDFYIDSELIGAVFYVQSIDNEVITALISNNGYYIDIYGPETDLAWAESPDIPVYALRDSTSNKQISGSNYAQYSIPNYSDSQIAATPPTQNMNAYFEVTSENNKSILRK